MLSEKEIEFLKESNAIEKEYSEMALEDSKIAWDFSEQCRLKSYDITTEFIKIIHKKLMKRLNPKIAGKIRKKEVWVGNRECLDYTKIETELKSLILLHPLYSRTNSLSAEENIKNWHIQFEKIHPFEDGNGRVGRILMNFQRLKLELPLLIIHEGKEQQEYYGWFK